MAFLRAFGPNRPRRLGEGDRCPVCGATSGVSEKNGTYRCLMCGAPRVLVDGIVQRRGSERPLLEQAKSLKLRRVAYAVVATLALVFGMVSLTFASILAAVAGTAGMKGVFFAASALLPLAISAWFFFATRRSAGQISETLAQAEIVVAKELIESGRAPDAVALGRLMHLPAGRAEEVFGRAEVERMLDPSAEAPAQRLRVDAGQETPLESDEPSARERARQR